MHTESMKCSVVFGGSKRGQVMFARTYKSVLREKHRGFLELKMTESFQWLKV